MTNWDENLIFLAWNGVHFVSQGPYEGAVFRFTIHIPETFPDGECPVEYKMKMKFFSSTFVSSLKKVIFNPIVFHPQINPETGELDVHRYFPVWKFVAYLFFSDWFWQTLFLSIIFTDGMDIIFGKFFVTFEESFRNLKFLTQVISKLHNCEFILRTEREEVFASREVLSWCHLDMNRTPGLFFREFLNQSIDLKTISTHRILMNRTR